MKEITFFGRGGQGAVIASEILAEAYFQSGFEVQCFPSFGVERRGAPVTAFLRIDREFIFLRSMIYQADIGLVLAAGLVEAPTFASSLKNNATVLINSPTTIPTPDGLQAVFVDATGIARRNQLGSAAQPLVNTAILGAYARITGELDLENLLNAVAKKVPQKTEQNQQAVREAFQAVTTHG